MSQCEAIIAWLCAHPPCAVLAWYVLMSVVTLAFYWRDKHAALAGEWRTPESTLHLLELLGGWPGALVGQKKLHHKCSKVSYQIEFWLVVVVNVLGLVYLTYGWLSNDWSLDGPRGWLHGLSEDRQSVDGVSALE